MTIQQKLHLPMRTSTAVLILLFVGLLVLYFWVRPDTAATSNTGQDSPQTGQQATNPPADSPTPTPAPSTTSPSPSATPSTPSPRPRRSSPAPTPSSSTPGSTPLPTPTPTPTASTPVAAPSG